MSSVESNGPDSAGPSKCLACPEVFSRLPPTEPFGLLMRAGYLRAARRSGSPFGRAQALPARRVRSPENDRRMSICLKISRCFRNLDL